MIHTCAQCGKEFTGRKKKYCSTECSEEVRRRKNKERWRKANPGWNDGTNKVCEWCGKEFTVPARNAHIARFCSGKCKDTWWSRTVHGYKPIEERNEERRKQKLIRQKRLEKEREARYLERLTTKTCEWCGEEFITDTINKLTCSKECSRKRKNRINHLNSDRRINENNLIDRDITLEKLFKRDGGVCYICGEVCDYEDRAITTDGHFISGRTYPSIDHVYPLARGGMHSWDNVRLAHHSCNGEKSDDLAIGIEPLPKDIAYSLARKISPRRKKTTQHTLDGELVGVFDSTFEAERKTGLKAKGIQRCARGEAKTYKGYIWRYA